MTTLLNRRSFFMGATTTTALTASSAIANNATFDIIGEHAGLIEDAYAAEGQADLLTIPNRRIIQITTAADRAAISAGRLVLYNRPRRSGQAVDRLELDVVPGQSLTKTQTEAVEFVWRDRRNDEQYYVDERVVKQVHHVQQQLGVALTGSSMYRSPETQRMLIARSKDRNGGDSQVATRSYHSNSHEKVMAVDLVCEPGSARLMQAVLRTCREFRRGGHSHYPGGNFVHMDSAHFRTW